MVEAQTVREVEQEPAANDKPEPWITAEAVNLTNRAAGHQPPKHLAVQTGWIVLKAQGPPTSFRSSRQERSERTLEPPISSTCIDYERSVR